MPKPKTKSCLALDLANFNLTVDGYRLLLTTDNPDTLRAVRENFTRLNPDIKYRTENFGVKPSSKAETVRHWKKIPGYSFWEPVIGHNKGKFD
jgi:hypothetical protein